ncbi:MAG: DUF131 domain-containing protein [Infirmifilum sp.]
MRREDIGLSLVLLGFLVIVVGALLAVVEHGETGGSVGGCVLIGPVPICFGYGEVGGFLMLASAAVMLVLMLCYVILYVLTRRYERGVENSL